MLEAATTKSPIVPCLTYRDAPAAIEFLCKAFGFERKMVVPGENDTIAHAELTCGNAMIMIGTTKETGYGKLMRTPRDAGGATQSIYLVVDDADAHHAQAKATAARWRARAATLEAKANTIAKDVSNEIARIAADRDAALVELRARPSRDTPAITTTIAGTCTTPVGGTGAFLFREDSDFLTREAARADTIRTSLKACYAQYDNARDALAEER